MPSQNTDFTLLSAKIPNLKLFFPAKAQQMPSRRPLAAIRRLVLRNIIVHLIKLG